MDWRFSMLAAAKLLRWRDSKIEGTGRVEVGCFAETDPDRPGYIVDVHMVKQVCTPATTKFDDAALANYMRDGCEGRLNREGKKLAPKDFFRVWIHTHPSNAVGPSGVDEETFAKVLGHLPSCVMMILGTEGKLGISMKLRGENGIVLRSGPAETVLGALVDFWSPHTLTAADYEKADADYKTLVSEPVREIIGKKTGAIGGTGTGEFSVFMGPLDGRSDTSDTTAADTKQRTTEEPPKEQPSPIKFAGSATELANWQLIKDFVAASVETGEYQGKRVPFADATVRLTIGDKMALTHDSPSIHALVKAALADKTVSDPLDRIMEGWVQGADDPADRRELLRESLIGVVLPAGKDGGYPLLKKMEGYQWVPMAIRRSWDTVTPATVGQITGWIVCCPMDMATSAELKMIVEESEKAGFAPGWWIACTDHANPGELIVEPCQQMDMGYICMTDEAKLLQT